VLNWRGNVLNWRGKVLNWRGKVLNWRGKVLNWRGKVLNWRGKVLNWRGKALNWRGKVLNWRGNVLNWRGKVLNWRGKVLNWRGKVLNWRGKVLNWRGKVLNWRGKVLNWRGAPKMASWPANFAEWHRGGRRSREIDRGGVINDKQAVPENGAAERPRNRSHAERGNEVTAGLGRRPVRRWRMLHANGVPPGVPYRRASPGSTRQLSVKTVNRADRAVGVRRIDQFLDRKDPFNRDGRAAEIRRLAGIHVDHDEIT